MPKNIVICCDGTGNEIEENLSNVLKLYRILKKDKQQLAYYDPGIGTLSESSNWAKFKNKAKGVFGLATGYGLDDNVLDAYKFLIQHYVDGDQIYLFGFSRGSYTVRVLAGFINLIGLLKPEQINLCGYAITAYKQSSEKSDLAIGWRFQKITASRHITIRFIGVWDTVGSVIVPRQDRLYLPSLQTLPYTKKNPCVRVFRHAMAIDERRRMFRLYPWQEPQKFKTNPFVKDEVAEDQDIQQVWFPGVHSDIGGGYKESESGAAKIPLKWMIEEAVEHELKIKKRSFDILVLGKNPKNSKHHYVAPNPNTKLHNSMKEVWPLLEIIPKYKTLKEWPTRKIFLWTFYFPLSEPRKIPDDANIHPSADEPKDNKRYKPINLPGVAKRITDKGEI